MNKWGWKRSLPDHRDRVFNLENVVAKPHQLPASVDLAPKMPAIVDQSQIGSCTGNGWARVGAATLMAEKEDIGPLSRLFIYWNERFLEGTPPDQDAGAEVRTGAKVLATLGAPPETDWAYDITQFAVKPPQKAYDDALKHKALVYKSVIPGGPGAPIRSALAQGLPIVFGFSVPDYFETGWDYTKPLPLPTKNTQMVGGHCVVATGYKVINNRLAIQCDNSWGPDWALNGRFWMDASYFDPSVGLATDLWVVLKES